jgi:hypothetical protein
MLNEISGGGGGESPLHMGLTLGSNHGGPIISTILQGKSQAITSRMGIGRRPRSKVRIRVVGACLLGWVEVVKAWGASVKAMVVDNPNPFKDI